VEAVPGVPAVGLAVLVGEPNQAGPYVIRVKVEWRWWHFEAEYFASLEGRCICSRRLLALRGLGAMSDLSP
jgi:hypothetical protein